LCCTFVEWIRLI